jgi:hypothetical protein
VMNKFISDPIEKPMTLIFVGLNKLTIKTRVARQSFLGRKRSER